jgi:hypothetical protein
MLKYHFRKKLEKTLKYIPNILSDTLVNLINPIRIKYIKKVINPYWITLFITNYCSARCGHCFYSKELNNKVEELHLSYFFIPYYLINIKKIKKEKNFLELINNDDFIKIL